MENVNKLYEFKDCDNLKINGAEISIRSGIWPVYESYNLNYVTVIMEEAKLDVNTLDFQSLKLQRKAQLSIK